MWLRDKPIRQKLMTILRLTSGVVVVLTCAAFLAYEVLAFRQATLKSLSTLGAIIATNSTASLAFQNEGDAREILSALRAEPHIVAAALYDKDGRLFSRYPADLAVADLPAAPARDGYRFEGAHLVGFEPVAQAGNARLGTLFLRSDLKAVYGTLRLAGVTAVAVMGVAMLVAYLLSNALQGAISRPILLLADTAKGVSERQDYSVRAPKLGDDELGSLTDAFNQMLGRIEEQNGSLRQLIAELERSNKELEQFAYVASHDLQEPLRMVSSYTQLLERRYGDKLDEKGRKFVDFAVDGAVRMQQLINDLLEFSRVSTRGKPMKPVDMNRVLDTVKINLSVAIRESDAVVTNDQLPTVLADETQLVQLLQNLVGNAIKFRRAPPARPEVHVSAQVRETECVFTVRDNGIGIAPEYFERIFVIFQRLHAKGEYPGTGIGLAVCRRIVERHGGRIWVESAPGQGSTFYFALSNGNGEQPL
jgi:signal transduction histidine kinase